MAIDKESIRHRALELAAAGGQGVGARLAQEFGISRQVANNHLKKLVDEGLLEAAGSTRAKVHALHALDEATASYRREGLDEHHVWQEFFLPRLQDLPQNVLAIWEYGLTEIINNAVDHSGAQQVTVRLMRNALFTECGVADDGAGIFLKIQRALGLHDPREALLELAKGKLTTDPERHTGEGIFFTSRMMDEFHIRSGHLRFRSRRGEFDMLEEIDEPVPGTQVTMRLDNASPRRQEEIFDRYADPVDYTFDKTVVPLRLAQFAGQRLVSRSQAKRVAARFEKFKQVQLDFSGIETIGQAFADELFRVYAKAHPDVRLVPVNTSPAVDRMIRRVVAGQQE